MIGRPRPRTARNTAVNWAASSMPDETRTTRRQAWPRSPTHLNPLECTLRVIVNVKHKDSSKPCASSKSSTSRTALKEGLQSTAYAQAPRHHARPFDAQHLGGTRMLVAEAAL